jgi:hypothetical protein
MRHIGYLVVVQDARIYADYFISQLFFDGEKQSRAPFHNQRHRSKDNGGKRNLNPSGS